MARKRLENGPRYVEEEDYKAHTIRVATGYDPRSDQFPLHVYVQQACNAARKLDTAGLAFDTERQAFTAGFKMGHEAIDAE